MNVKGSAAGGGNAQAIPLTEFSLGLAGDINNIMNAHNLAMVALQARMQHERNYTDAELAKRKLKTTRRRPEERPDGLDYRLLRPVPQKYRHWPGRKMDGFHDAVPV